MKESESSLRWKDLCKRFEWKRRIW